MYQCIPAPRSVTISSHRWTHYIHPKQEALLKLAQEEDLSTLSPTQIADKLAITGPNRGAEVRRLMQRLQINGLLPFEASRDYQYTHNTLREFASYQDVTKVPLPQLADLIGLTGPYKVQYAWYHLDQLRKEGVIS